jgi:hypothetical protein
MSIHNLVKYFVQTWLHLWDIKITNGCTDFHEVCGFHSIYFPLLWPYHFEYGANWGRNLSNAALWAGSLHLAERSLSSVTSKGASSRVRRRGRSASPEHVSARQSGCAISGASPGLSRMAFQKEAANGQTKKMWLAASSARPQTSHRGESTMLLHTGWPATRSALWKGSRRSRSFRTTQKLSGRGGLLFFYSDPPKVYDDCIKLG